MDNTEKKATPGKIALAVAAVIVLAAVLIAIVVTGLSAADSEVTTTAETVEVAETVAATIPADGNPNDETAKGTYTAADEEVIAAADAVVARMGDYVLTNGQLQVYYWLEVQSFVSTYGDYVYYFGLDLSQPLDTQVCTISENGGTWQQFFLAGALNTWQNYQALSAEAELAGYELSAEMQAELDNIPASMEQNAALYGFGSVEELLAYNVGGAATMEDYLHFMNLYYPGTLYYNEQVEANVPSEEAIEAYFDANAAEYEASGLTKDMKYVDIRHVLIMPEGADSSTIRTETFDEAAWEASRVKAQELLESWEQGDKSEDSFAALAMEHSQDGSAADGGLYTDVTEGQMVEAFNDWCFDAERKSGDYGIVETEFGYHLMYFVDSRPMWKEYAESDLKNEFANSLLNDAVTRYPMEVEFDKILLAYVDTDGVEDTVETVEEPANAGTADKAVLVIAGISIAALCAAAYVFGKKEHH